MGNLNKMLLMVFFGVAVLCFGSASRVDAVPMLTLTDGITTVVVTDEDLLGPIPSTDIDARGINQGPAFTADPGFVKYNGSIGIWDITVTTGKVKPAAGWPNDLPLMFLDNFTAHSTGAGTLTVTFNETDFITPFMFPNVNGLANSASGDAAGTVAVNYYLGSGSANNNHLYNTHTNTLLNPLGGASGVFDESAGYLFPFGIPSSPYALTIVGDIEHFAAGTSDFDASIGFTQGPAAIANPVPEPSTILLIGIGLAGLGSRCLYKRRSLNSKRKEA